VHHTYELTLVQMTKYEACHKEYRFDVVPFLQSLLTEEAKRKQLEDMFIQFLHSLKVCLIVFHDKPKMSSLQVWSQNLARWSEKSGIDSRMSAKSTRKVWRAG